MAKLMAPNIRIDWYPEDHFEDALNPTLRELNSGYNLSPAIVTGFTLDFADSETEAVTTVFDFFETEKFNRHTYEASMQFFLATRGSWDENERAFLNAEELFYQNTNSIGHFVKRFGYRCEVSYAVGQTIDVFKVQANLPKIVTEEGSPILLDISFIPKGEAAPAVLPSWD